MAKILVTRATGFIGAPLVEKLRTASMEVFPVSSRDGDISETATWNSFPTTDFVIHLAARTFVIDSWMDPAGSLKANCFGTTCALNYCRKHKSKLVFISSYLYGDPESLPISEEAKISASNPYAAVLPFFKPLGSVFKLRVPGHDATPMEMDSQYRESGLWPKDYGCVGCNR